jgi:hypothetical protein
VRPSGTARAKFPAVAAIGSPVCFARSEYTPHAVPAASLSAAERSGGAQ